MFKVSIVTLLLSLSMTSTNAFFSDQIKCVSELKSAVEAEHDIKFADAHVAQRNIRYNEELDLYEVVATDEWAGSVYFVKINEDCSIKEIKFFKDLDRLTILSL